MVEGDWLLTESPAIVESFWLAMVAYIEVSQLVAAPVSVEAKGPTDLEEIKKLEEAVREREKEQERKIAELYKQANDSATYATKLAEMMDFVNDEAEPGYCPCCLSKADHQKFRGKRIYVCAECGNATARCAMPKCEHFGAADFSRVPTAVICAGHKQEVPDFTRLDVRIGDPRSRRTTPI